MDISTMIAIAAMVVSAASTVWVGGFRFSALIHEVKTLGARVDKLEDKMDKQFEKLEARIEKFETRMYNFQIEMHKLDIRLTVMEQRKPE